MVYSFANLLINAVTLRCRAGGRWLLPYLGVALLAGSLSIQTAVADLAEAQQQFLSGNYKACISTARQEVNDSPRSEEWQLLLSKALLATGQYPAALQAITNALSENRSSIRLRWQAREVLLANGRTNEAAQIPDNIVRTVASDPRSYREPEDIVVFGQCALLAGADPKRVLDTVFDTVKKADSKLRDVYLAAGELALEKHNFDVAAKQFQEGLQQLPDDPDLQYGLARAYAESDQALMISSLESVLEHNSNHVGSLLMLADHCIDAEDYTQADKLLDQVKAVNPWNPDAWAYRSILAHLRAQPDAEQSARQTALKFWSSNPRVDHLIGKKLSQKYRFAEGSAHQRQALKFDPDYLPAKAQLSQDLLRLGDETEGWRLADEVQKGDGYDAEAFNLVNLRDTMAKFTTLTNADFHLRMGKQEADLYGKRALDLLMRARTNLCAKYGLDLNEPTTVEIFPAQKDFAVRTFGMPGNPGYLGVCFGSVITANSPTSQGGTPINWESVLWHEFCHVVTLHITKNKMPRWLSEGISVYEERQANPAWGEHLNPQYREMILGDDLTPVSKLSGAFLTPRSAEYLQFAYYESSLVVEYIVQRFGMDQLKAILRDLGDGAEINSAIEKHTAPIAKLDKDFETFARDKAEKLAPGLDWEKPEFAQSGTAARPGRGRRGSSRGSRSIITTNSAAIDPYPVGVSTEDNWETWTKSHPNNFWALTHQVEQLVERKQWAEAKPVLKKLIDAYPDYTGSDSPYLLLAAVHRSLAETNEERQVLARFAEKDAEAPEAYLRLMQLDSAAKDWPAVLTNADRYLAVNPMVAPPYRFLAQASEETGKNDSAIDAYQSLLHLDPSDPSEVHFRLAAALHRDGNPGARRQVLEALEDAPRYQAALRLLLKINQESPQPAASVTETDTAKPAAQ